MALDLEDVMECLGNPLKARIMIMIRENGPLTPKEMLSVDDRIPQATLYRALRNMEERNVIVTASECKVRAVVEKRYRLNDELKGRIDEMMRTNDGDVYFKLFMGFALELMRRFEDYCRQEGIDIIKDGSGFFSVPVYATKEELDGFYAKAVEDLKRMQVRRSEDQQLHTLAFIATPPMASGTRQATEARNRNDEIH